MPSFDVYSVHFGNKDLAGGVGYIWPSRKSQQVFRTLTALCTCVHRSGWQTQTFHWGLKIEKLSGNHVSTSSVAHMKAFLQRRTRSHRKACVCSCVCRHLLVLASIMHMDQEDRNWCWVFLSIAHHFELEFTELAQASACLCPVQKLQTCSSVSSVVHGYWKSKPRSPWFCSKCTINQIFLVPTKECEVGEKSDPFCTVKTLFQKKGRGMTWLQRKD